MKHFKIQDLLSQYINIDKPLEDKPFKGFCHNSVELEPGQVFLALQGEKCHGLRFIKQVYDRGAVFTIAESTPQAQQIFENLTPQLQSKVYFVKSPFEILRNIALHIRQYISFPIVAITGTVGKTSLKDFAKQCFFDKNIYVSKKNWNNIFGLYLNLSSMPLDSKVAFFECGISHKGEMKAIVDSLIPNIVLITNIAESHLDFLENIENVAKEKSLLCSKATSVHLPGSAFKLLERTGSLYSKAHYFIYDESSKSPSDRNIPKKSFSVYQSQDDGCVISKHFYPRKKHLKSYDNLFVLLVGVQVELHEKYQIDLKLNLSLASEKDGRGQLKVLEENIELFDHSYNCSPESLRAILKKIQLSSHKCKKVLVVGDIYEQPETLLTRFFNDYTILLKEKNIDYYHIGNQGHLWPSVTKVINDLRDLDCINQAQAVQIFVTASRGFKIERYINQFISTEYTDH